MSTVTAESTREHRVTVPSLRARKRHGERIAMLTAYDFTFASLFDQAGIDVLLVGDSLGNVVQGQPTTLPVTLDETIYHTRLVARGARRALVVADLPFGSYQISSEDASAQRGALREGGRRARGQARGRPQRRRDDRAHRGGRDPGDGARRPHAAGDPPDGRPPRAGPRRERPRPRARGCARGRGGGRLRGGAGGHARGAGRRDHARARDSRPSGSARGSTATGRCW